MSKSFHLSNDYIARRHGAYATDFVLWLALGQVLFRYSGMIEFVKNNVAPDKYWMTAGIIYFGYRLLFLCKDGLAGCSPGKWAYDLRVVDESSGVPIRPLRSILRNMILIVPIAGELILWVQLHFGRRWFDKLAKCKVVSIAGDGNE